MADTPTDVGRVRLSGNERALLLAMNEYCSTEYEEFGGKVCYSFATLAEFCPAVHPSLIRRTVRALARKGLTGFERGLMTEDGDLAGAGYGIEKAGRAVAAIIAQKEGF